MKTKIIFAVFQIEDLTDCINLLIELANKKYYVKNVTPVTFDEGMVIAYSKEKISAKELKLAWSEYTKDNFIFGNETEEE